MAGRKGGKKGSYEMTRKQAYRASCAALAMLGMMQNAAYAVEGAATPVLVPAGATGSVGATAYNRGVNPTTQLTVAQKVKLLQQKVKYVFVIFQENRSFDHYFGTYPGANGLFDANGNLITTNPGATQVIRNIDGSYGTVSPFLIPPTVKDVNGNPVQLYPEDTTSIDHSHTGIAHSAHFLEQTTRPATAQNDAYALDEEGLAFSGASSDPSTVVNKSNGRAPTANPTLAQKQMAEVAVSHIDCDTIPFLWNYADRFTLFDNFRQTTIGPSTPNAIAIIAGQSGETQWALHPNLGANGTVPVVGDPGPFPGSNKDHAAVKPPYGPDENPASPNGNLTFATLPLSFAGNKIGQIIAQDENPAADLLDVQHDIWTIASKDPNVNWGWYQQGFDAEPFDGSNLAGASWPLHASYIVHHNGPQYFGYLGDNKTEIKNLHGLGDFFSDVAAQKLPAQGGVFYVRGGYANNDGLVPVVPNAAEKATFPGNDDHPGYSDAFISEALVADSVNAIANSPYWKDSAIIITYDETDGLYDHAPLSIRAWDQNNVPLTGGPRIPTIVISPYSVTHAISTQYSEHSSVIKFINELFGLVPLADLPDEQYARQLGKTELNQANLGPADDVVPGIGDLLEAFDNDRLSGNAPVLPASYAVIPASVVTSLPHYNRAGCSALNITPTDYPNGLSNPPTDLPPADFNPRPGTAPGIPTSGNWNP
jgi:phospholipase C